MRIIEKFEESKDFFWNREFRNQKSTWMDRLEIDHGKILKSKDRIGVEKVWGQRHSGSKNMF